MYVVALRRKGRSLLCLFDKATTSISFKERGTDLMWGECVDGFDDYAAQGAEQEVGMMPRCKTGEGRGREQLD